jgi:hypothetical protein
VFVVLCFSISASLGSVRSDLGLAPPQLAACFLRVHSPGQIHSLHTSSLVIVALVLLLGAIFRGLLWQQVPALVSTEKKNSCFLHARSQGSALHSPLFVC